MGGSGIDLVSYLTTSYLQPLLEIEIISHQIFPGIFYEIMDVQTRPLNATL